MKIYGFLFFIFFFVGEAFGQIRLPADSTILYIGGQAHYGFILPHRRAIRPLVNDTNPWGLSMEISRLRYTQLAWNACNCYSQNGLSLMYFNFDNPEVLGSSISLVVFAEPHLSFKTFNMSLRAGLGLSYLTKVYDWESNPDNVLFGSPLGGILLLQLTTRVWLSENFGIRLSAAYHHISNGGSQQPNLGMNFPTVSIGAEYSIGRIGLVPKEKHYVSKNTMQYYAGVFFTTRKVSTNDNLRKPVLGLSGGFFKPFARMHGVGIGIELVNDWSLKERNRQSVEYIDHRIVSGLLRHHFLFGKFDFSQAIGFYLYKQYPTQRSIFQRYSLQYRITKNIEFGFSLKAHLAVAEQMDVRVSYLF
jgi:Lipid A 3-O-deacylase (PagL)